MPTEPNHRMDELLRSYAQKRKGQAGQPFELPPATRRALQEEVVRVFHEPGGHAREPLFSTRDFWPRLLIGGGAIALLLIGAGLWLRVNDHRDAQLARLQDSNLFLFANSAPESLSGASPPARNPLPDPVRAFSLDDRTASVSVPAPSVAANEQAEQPARADITPPEGEIAGRRGERVEVAASFPSEETYSNVARYRLGLPGAPAVDSARRGQGQLPVAKGAPSGALTGLAASGGIGGGALAPGSALGLSQEKALELARKTPAEPNWSYRGLLPDRNSSVRITPTPATRGLQRSGDNLSEAAARPQAVSARQVPLLVQRAAETSPEQRGNYYFQQIDPGSRYRQNLNSPPLPKVLTRFEVQQSGDNLRIIDADSSIYEGTIQVQSSGPPAAEPEAAPYSFTAVGTNLTLNKQVVFTGQFDPAASPQPSPGQVSAGRLSAGYEPAPVMQSLQERAAGRAVATQGSTVSNLAPISGRIEGDAVIGGKNQFRIEAQRVAP